MTLFSKFRNGGGLRVLALLLAGALAACMFAPAAAPAAETPQYDLWWVDPSFNLVKAEGKFVRLGQTTTPYTDGAFYKGETRAACAVDSNGAVWAYKGFFVRENEQGGVVNGLIYGYQYGMDDAGTLYKTDMSASACTDPEAARYNIVPMHSDLWSAGIGGKHALGIDENGALWLQNGADTTPVHAGVTFSSGVDSAFHITRNATGAADQIAHASDLDPNANIPAPTLLLGSDRPRTQAATVAAVPTTGAPNSDLALLAAGMVGGGLILRKRRDRSRA